MITKSDEIRYIIISQVRGALMLYNPSIFAKKLPKLEEALKSLEVSDYTDVIISLGTEVHAHYSCTSLHHYRRMEKVS